MSEAMGYRFLCGADMDPTAIRAAHPAASFVARARIAGDAGEVWGVLIAGAGLGEGAPVGEATTDDGRRFAAAIPSPAPTGDPAAVLAAARYWELSPAYVRRLAAAWSGAAGRDDGADG